MFEAFRMGQESSIEGDRALPGQFGGTAQVYGFRGHEGDTGMPMLGVTVSLQKICMN